MLKIAKAARQYSGIVITTNIKINVKNAHRVAGGSKVEVAGASEHAVALSGGGLEEAVFADAGE